MIIESEINLAREPPNTTQILIVRHLFSLRDIKTQTHTWSGDYHLLSSGTGYWTESPTRFQTVKCRHCNPRDIKDGSLILIPLLDEDHAIRRIEWNLELENSRKMINIYNFQPNLYWYFIWIDWPVEKTGRQNTLLYTVFLSVYKKINK